MNNGRRKSIFCANMALSYSICNVSWSLTTNPQTASPFVIFANSIGQGVNTSNKPCSDLNDFLFYLDYTN